MQISIWIYVRVSSEPVAVEIAKLFLAGSIRHCTVYVTY